MNEQEVYAIINKINALEPGKACIYFRGKSCWMEKIPERMRKKLIAFFDKLAADRRVYFVQRRIDNERVGHFDYIAVKSKRIYH